MPSSMIFIGLVVMWLLILVPAVARRRQEVARPSVTALSGRVLERTPRRDPEAEREPPAGRDVEVDVRQELEPGHAVATRAETERRSRGPGVRDQASPVPDGRALDGPDGWARRADRGEADADRAPSPRTPANHAPDAPARYRRGRGSYDPEAAAVAARARYVFRQRVVLILFILCVGSAVAAVFTLPQLWWVHGAFDVGLVGYLAYLRRQVRVEEAIRQRRSARAAAPRRAPVAEDDDAGDERPDASQPADLPPPRDPASAPDVQPTSSAAGTDDVTPDRATGQRDGGSRADRSVAGLGLRARRPKPSDDAEDERPALPRLKPMPTPPVPIGTILINGEEEDPALHELDSVIRPDYRRASGQ